MENTAILDGYYERFPSPNEARADTGRFPRNHVRYAAKLKPLEWLNAVHLRIGFSPLSIERAALAAFDKAAPYDKCLGTTEELRRLRDVVAIMARGLDSNPYLLGVGRLLVKKFVTERLKARRAVLKHYTANKAFIESRGKLRAPVIITGFARTGSTLLQRLMAEDSDARSPFTFEMEIPLPPLTADKDAFADLRITQAGSALAQLVRIAPGFIEKLSESHLWSATEYEESYIYMLAHNGLLVVDGPNAGDSYARALFTDVAYHRSVLRYERLFFTMLDAYRPAKSHWILKAPNYAPALPFVFDEYPDARIVITHRNPLITLPSVCRLMESWCIAFNRDGCFDKHRFAKHVTMFSSPYVSVPFRYRQANPAKEHQIFDCMYDELFADPIAMVKRIYDFFGLRFTSIFEQRMLSYLDHNRQGKYGRHRYSLEEYAIDPKEFLSALSDYMTHYGFGLENARQRKPAGLGTTTI